MSKQLIFIDDSGDPGFKLDKGSGRIFVIACVVFDDKYAAEFADASIKVLKNKMKWKQNYEFKFHRTNDAEKKKFFNNLKTMDFEIYAIVVDKMKINSVNTKGVKAFYQKIIIETIAEVNYQEEVEIYLDGRGDRKYRNKVMTNIRKVLSEKDVKIKKFKFVNSQNNNLVQLADMVAGAIHAEHNPEKRARQKLLKIIKEKIVKISKYQK